MIHLLGLCILSGCATELADPIDPHIELDEYKDEESSSEDDSELPDDLPGDPELDDSPPEESWGDVDLSCETDDDCGSDEACLNGGCQIDRCSAGGYESIAPMGDSFVFYADREFAVVDGEAYGGVYYADMYSPEGIAAEYDSSLPSDSGRIRGIAGGDFLGEGEDRYAGITETPSGGTLRMLHGDPEFAFAYTFDPVAIDAGDFDSDGYAEAVVIGEHQVRICDFVTGECDALEAEAELIDVTIADVDGDSIEEFVFLQRDADEWSIWIHNADSERTGQAESYTVDIEFSNVERISAGDLDGDGKAEIVVMDDKGFYGTRDDLMIVLSFVPETEDVELLLDTSVDYGRIVDIAVGDMDADGIAELVALDSTGEVISFSYEGSALKVMVERTIALTGEPNFIALGDHDGDSPRVELTEGPQVVSGAQVPIVLLYLPPFSYEHSNGFSYGGYGLGETYSENYTDTLSLSINADVGVQAEFLSLFKTSFTQKVAWKTSQTLGESSSLATGGRSSLRSDPDTFGEYYGAVVVSWGCFHAYTYEMVDPNDHYAGADGEPIVLTVPVDGGTAMLSTGRYNAMADVVGNLPQMPVPYKVGDPTTYPTEPETIYGDSIPEDDYVFPTLRWYEVSDVGYVGWFNQLGEASTVSSSTGMDQGVSANVTVSGIAVGAGFTTGWGQSYSVTRGETALFMGGIPPFVDDASTPADEYVDNFYRVAPIVYMQDYTDSTGKESKFYVSTYVVDL